MSTATQEQAALRINNLKGFLTVLQATKPASPKLLCLITLSPEGLRVQWEDDSKSLQGSVFLSQQLFADYSCPWARKQLGLPFGVLLDTLLVCHSSLSTSDLVIKFPGLHEELVCEMLEDEGEASTVSTWCKIDTCEYAVTRDLADYWEDPASYFLVSGAILKEAIEDFEWVAGGNYVTLSMQRSPPSVSLSAQGEFELCVNLTGDLLQGLHCLLPEVGHAYKYKNLHAMVANLPHAKDPAAVTSTKVTVDTNGLMKVTHMMSLQGAPHGVGGGPGGFPDSQLPGGGSSNAGIVHFMSGAEDVMGDA